MAITNIVIQNTFLRYLLLFGVLIVSFIGIKLIYFLFSKVFKALASKTKTRLDDLLFEALEKPIILLSILIALFLSKGFLLLSPEGDLLYTKILKVFLIISITWFVVKFVDALLENYLQPLTKKSKSKLDDTVYPVVKRLVNFGIYLVSIVYILQFLGIQITGLLAGLGIGGLAFALAAQDILSNFFGGAAIIADKPFRVGDRVKLEGNDGFVKKIGIRTTVLETFDGTLIVLPNKIVAHTVLENISAERARRVKLVLGLEYSTSSEKLKKAKKILQQIIKKNKSTDDNSLVHFKSFGDSSLNIQLIYWIKDLNNILQAQDEINFAIKSAFEKEGLEFAFPSQTVYLKK